MLGLIPEQVFNAYNKILKESMTKRYTENNMLSSFGFDEESGYCTVLWL